MTVQRPLNALTPCRRSPWLRAGGLLLALVTAPLATSAVVAAQPATGAAEVMQVPMDLQVPLILKVLIYDRNFAERDQSAVNIAVVFTPSDPTSLQARDEVLRALERVSDKSVGGRPIRFSAIESTRVADIEQAVLARKISVLYITPGNSANLEQLLRLSERNQVITVTGVPEYVNRGAAVGIGLRQDKPEILINLASARSAGGEFDASLLRIARVIR